MTLITYSQRVHFADGVLEEALLSELENCGRHRPLIIAESFLAGSELLDRVLHGLPRKTKAALIEISPASSARDAADTIVQTFESNHADVLIAAGSRRAIELARKARAQMARTGRGRAANAPSRRVEYYAIPGADGMPGPCRNTIEAGIALRGLDLKKYPPDVLFCDPTLTLGADMAQSVSAAVCALARSLEAYLSSGFNPPADGIAMDGLARVVASLPRLLESDTLDTRRELMAAGLNGMLALQKGRGAAQALGDALSRESGVPLDEGSVLRLLLPGALDLLDRGNAKISVLRRALVVPGDDSLSEAVADLLRPLPLPDRLADMGVERAALGPAAESAAETSNMSTMRAGVGAAQFHALLEAVY